MKPLIVLSTVSLLHAAGVNGMPETARAESKARVVCVLGALVRATIHAATLQSLVLVSRAEQSMVSALFADKEISWYYVRRRNSDSLPSTLKSSTATPKCHRPVLFATQC
ncbi:hypothetical protein C8R42DRAFT_676846 [Lentinula raphanica]|nr:hypothetical protein C8R42DRAFT_676846 [Lentinula raphanica]